MKKIIVAILTLSIFFSYTYAEEAKKSDDASSSKKAKQPTNIVIVGFPKGQAAGLQKEIKNVYAEIKT